MKCSLKCCRRTGKYRPLVLLCLLLSASGVGAAPTLSLNSGMVGIDDELEKPGRYGIEYRHRPWSRLALIPSVGYSRADNGATYTYVDVKRDFRLAERWTLTPSFGPGYFSEGGDLQLGHQLEFRSGLELSYRPGERWRLGVTIYHLSNGGLSEKNPGTEGVALHLLIPLDKKSPGLSAGATHSSNARQLQRNHRCMVGGSVSGHLIGGLPLTGPRYLRDSRAASPDWGIKAAVLQGNKPASAIAFPIRHAEGHE